MTQQEVYNYLKKKKGTAKLIAKSLNVSYSSVNHALRKMWMQGDISRKEIKSGQFYYHEYKLL